MNDYRNSVVAGMMNTLNYVNMFNHGVGDVQELLKENDSPEAVFNVSYLTVFSVVIKESDESNLPKLAQVGGKALSATSRRFRDIINSAPVGAISFFSNLHSLGPVKGLKPLCTGRLTDGSKDECPSRLPPFFGPLYSPRLI